MVFLRQLMVLIELIQILDIKENCVSCCWTCNKMKNNFSQKEFLEKINKIYCNFKSSTTIPQGSTSQANGDGNGENPKK